MEEAMSDSRLESWLSSATTSCSSSSPMLSADSLVTTASDIASSIQITATTHGLTDIGKLAQQLRDTLSESHDDIEVMQMAGELLDLCRSTQSTLLEAAMASNPVSA